MRGPQIIKLKIVVKIIELMALLGAVGFAPISMAQIRATATAAWGQAPSTFPSGLGTAGAFPPLHGTGVSFTRPVHPRSFGPSAIFLGDPFYADYPTQPWAVQPPPQVVIVQPANTADAQPETGSEPLLIELQGNRYVRFGGGGRQQSAERGTNAPTDYAEGKAYSSPQIMQRPSQSELPPAILIFRDGHREQAPEYAIIGGTLYASRDYWQSGHWTKDVQLSALNLPATIQANHNAGIKFILPSSPNEVVTRP